MSRTQILTLGAAALFAAYAVAMLLFFPDVVSGLFASYKAFFGGLL
jgi:hypothetical protein